MPLPPPPPPASFRALSLPRPLSFALFISLSSLPISLIASVSLSLSPSLPPFLPPSLYSSLSAPARTCKDDHTLECVHSRAPVTWPIAVQGPGSTYRSIPLGSKIFAGSRLVCVCGSNLPLCLNECWNRRVCPIVIRQPTSSSSSSCLFFLVFSQRKQLCSSHCADQLALPKHPGLCWQMRSVTRTRHRSFF